MESALTAQQGSALALLWEQGQNRFLHATGFTALPGNDAARTAIDRETIFDLASLTKAFSTMPILIQAMALGKIRLDQSVSEFFPHFPGTDVKIDHLIRHNSGLPAHEKFYERPSALARGYVLREEMIDWICRSPRAPLEGAPTVYSDLGMLLVGFALENIFGKTMVELFEEFVKRPLGLKRTGYRVLPHAPAEARRLALGGEKQEFVATALCPFHKRVLQGEVDDNNCWSIGGYSSHAGLFSTLCETMALLKFAAEQAQKFHGVFFPSPASRPPFTRGFMLYPGLRSVPGKEWQGAIGHTGFVGTAAWYHEASDARIVLLGNRVHPSREDTRFIETRLEIQRAVWEESGHSP